MTHISRLIGTEAAPSWETNAFPAAVGSCPLAWCSSTLIAALPAGPDWSDGQGGQADILTVAHSSDCSNRRAPTRRVVAASLVS